MFFSFLSFKAMSAFASAHVATTVVGASVIGAATIVAVDEVNRNPMLYDKLGNMVGFGVGTMCSPVFLLEDGLRKAGMDIHPKGLMYNSEGKSISEIWHESVPEGLPMKEVRHVNEVIKSVDKAMAGYKLSLQQISEAREKVLALQKQF